MKKFLRLLTFLVMLVPFVAKAQILEPVQWTEPNLESGMLPGSSHSR